jgi:predicted RNA-binding Zn ribbon-like protein
MEGLATGRLHGPGGPAPGGLALVQELLNTGLRPADGPSHLADLLADADAAQRWLAAALAQWAQATGQAAPDLRLGGADLAPLRRLRESVRALAAGADAALPGPVNVSLRFAEDGRVAYGTAATGWRALAALVAAEILLAQRTGTWERFKACPFPRCGIAFFDQTRNNNRVWHDVRTCGNRTNLQVSRRRRRTADAASRGVSA